MIFNKSGPLFENGWVNKIFRMFNRLNTKEPAID